ncbi:hypothetical protein CC79DRAFT_346666 [Sarocladium strictum]
MAIVSSAWLLLIAALVRSVAALQVTPGSPCAEFCVDQKGDDTADPKSSSTDGDDIVCNDFEFSSDKAGKKFQQCMTCLQGSDFAKGSESDLDWFLYNLRYSFDYCVFGDMQASAVDANPCATSEGCGSLTDALRKDMINSTDRAQYDYCEADSQAISGDGFGKCLSCVSAEATHSYISNFLVALAIGCEQRPAPGTILGLNETVFTKNTIQAVNPSELDPANQQKSGLALSTTVIVGISVGGFVVLLLALGCGYMQYRKRKNRQRASGWSFRCQARSGSMPTREELDEEEAKQARFHEVMGQRMWTSPTESRVTGVIPAPPASTMSDSKSSTKDGITSIVTRLPPRPTLQTSGRNFHNSPTMDEYATPSSAISTRSTKPLLRNDSPAAYSTRSFSSHYGQAANMSRTSPSPLTAQSGNSGWEDQRRIVSGSRTFSGSPVMTRQGEVRNFSTTFPPPPQR